MSKPVAMIVTGTRHAEYGIWRVPVTSILNHESLRGRQGVLLHGAGRGIDWIASKIGGMFGWSIVPVPAVWSRGKIAGPMRNRAMLAILKTLQEQGYDVVCCAFHNDLEGSRGTLDMVRRCLRAGVPVNLVDERGRWQEMGRHDLDHLDESDPIREFSERWFGTKEEVAV